MRKLTIIILLGALGCRIAEVVETRLVLDYELKIINSTDYDMSINAFRNGKKCDSMDLKAGSSYSKKIIHSLITNGKGPNESNPYIFSNEFYGERDSVIIKFGKSRFIKQINAKRKEDKNSLYNIPEYNTKLLDYRYSPRNNTRYYGTYQYYFTKEDYDKASIL